MISLDQAQAQLAPHAEAVFVAPYREAVGNWHELSQADPTKAIPLGSTARANMIHCWVQSGVRRAIQGQTEIREIQSLGFFAVAVGADPLIRFKLLRNGNPSNVATEQQELLARHQYKDETMTALAFEGIVEPPTILTCGYVLDEMANLKRVTLCNHYGDVTLWEWRMWQDGDAPTRVETIPLPGLAQPEPARVVSARGSAQEERGAR